MDAFFLGKTLQKTLVFTIQHPGFRALEAPAFRLGSNGEILCIQAALLSQLYGAPKCNLRSHSPFNSGEFNQSQEYELMQIRHQSWRWKDAK